MTSLTRACLAAIHAENVIQRAFELEARSTCRRLGAANDALKPGEETLTETMLLELGTHYSDVVDVGALTKPRERQIGADWIWLFHNGVRYLPVLVQAKRIQEHVLEDNWSIKINTAQLAQLEKSAALLKIPAAYCLYFPSGWHSICKEHKRNLHGIPLAPIGTMHFVPIKKIRSKGSEFKVGRMSRIGTLLTELACCDAKTKKGIAPADSILSEDIPSHFPQTLPDLFERIRTLELEDEIEGAVRFGG